MTLTLPMVEARNRLSNLPEEFAQSPEMAKIRQGICEIKAGKGVPFEQVNQEPGL